ncbi:hypothetical protein HUN08_02975 [Gordonia sp. X0973]|uniref:hypothetical protein n=1 Tax=Gordonia sp. X0973 TaxID=2742602 RepID=UPI000F5439A3|nr:hypothetical protein [Gordonia sp. X0973]QKT06274.1 hypothetical protein HUN08_02975 [Gordonia sp. X0973]
MTAFAKLRELVVPPATGTRPDWAAVAAHLRFTPPDDFKQIVETYGPGLFAGEVAVWIPGGSGGEDLYEVAPDAMAELADSRDWVRDNNVACLGPDGANHPVEIAGDPLPYAAWGGGSSGSYGYWHRIGDDPNKWPVLYTDLSSLWLYHDGGIAAFLVDLLSEKYQTELVELGGEAPTFDPLP